MSARALAGGREDKARAAPEPTVLPPPPAEEGGAPTAVSTTGDMAVAEGARVQEPLEATGTVRVGGGARLGAGVRAGAGANVGDGARIEGALEVDGPLAWGRGASAARVRARGALTDATGRERARFVEAEGGILSVEQEA